MAKNHTQRKDVPGGNLVDNEIGDNAVRLKHPDVDRGWAWLVAIGMAMFYFTIGGFFRSFGVVFAAVLERFDQTASVTSLLPGVRSVCLIVVGPAATILSQRLTERAVIMTGAITVTAGFVLSYFATSLQFLIFSIGMLPGLMLTAHVYAYQAATYMNTLRSTMASTELGIGTSLIVGPSNVMMGRYFNRRRARAITVASSVGCLGQIVVPLVMVHLIETYSVQGALLIFGGIIFHSVLTGLIMKPIDLSSTTLDKNESETGDGDRCLTEKISWAGSIEIIRKDEISDGTLISSRAIDDMETNRRTAGKELTSVNVVNEGNKGLLYDIRASGENDVKQVVNKDDMKPLTIKSVEEVSDETDEEMEWKPVSKANNVHLKTTNHELEPLSEKDGSAQDGQRHSQTVVSSSCPDESATRRTCFQAAIRFVREMYPLELLLNAEYSLVLAATMLSLAMLVCQQNYLFVMCKSLGFSGDQSAMFLSVFGGADMIGRLSAGQLSDRKVLQPQHVMAIACFISGTAFSFVPLASSVYAILPLVIIIGGFINVSLILVMPAMVEIIGLETFPKAFAMLLAFHGIIASISPPLFGLIKDFSGKYDAMFPLTGGLQVSAGLLLVLECCLRKRAKNNRESS